MGGTARNRIARLNADGSLDTTFINPNANNPVYTIVVQGDGKILIGGTFTSVSGITRNRIARLSSLGALDLTFNPNSNGTVWNIKIQTDGSVVFGGQFTTV